MEQNQSIYDYAMWLYDELWDESVGLCGVYSREYDQRFKMHKVRDTAYYALGLLKRGCTGDISRAALAIEAVLKEQFVCEGEEHNGTFRFALETPDPVAKIAWEDYDPNWREFIAVIFAVILERFSPLLDNRLIQNIDEAMCLACETSYQRAMVRTPEMADNIFIMHIFIMDFFGRRFNRSDWVEYAEFSAKRCYHEFMENKAFPEYNSPTYYGVDIPALMCWEQISRSECLKKYSSEMINAVLDDIKLLYNPYLNNVCGPYVRSYGIDMQKYISGIGMLLYEAAGGTGNMVPKLIQEWEYCEKIGKLNDIAGIFLIKQLKKLSYDQDSANKDNPFPRTFSKTIISQPFLQKASAYIEKDYMLGAMYGMSRLNSQRHPLTIHWSSDGKINTFRLVIKDENGADVKFYKSSVQADASVDKNNASLCITQRMDEPQYKVGFELCCENVDEIICTRDGFHSASMDILIDGNYGEIEIVKMNQEKMIIYIGFVKQAAQLETIQMNIKAEYKGGI